MKYFNLFAILLLLSSPAFSQIIPGEGILDFDSCKFESLCNIVKPDTSVRNIWQTGKPSKPFFDTAYSGPNAIVTDTVHPYPVSNHSCFDLAVRNLYFFNMIVGFRHKFQTDTLTDGGYIEVSLDKGLTWMNIIHSDTTAMIFSTENMYTIRDTLKGGINGFSGTSAGWIYSRIQWIWTLPLKIFPPPDTVILRFHFISDSTQTNKAGWMIDNILISAAKMSGSINETSRDVNSIEIFPNPYSELTTIKFNQLKVERHTLIIVNTLGQTVKEFKEISDHQVQLRKEDLNSGIYFVLLQNNQKTLAARKLIVE